MHKPKELWRDFVVVTSRNQPRSATILESPVSLARASESSNCRSRRDLTPSRFEFERVAGLLHRSLSGGAATLITKR